MIFILLIPEVVEDVTEVRVLQWNAEVGHAFLPNELIVELETHKALVEVRAERPGVLRKIISPEGAWLSIGEPLAILSDSADEPLPEDLHGLENMAAKFDVS